MHLLATEDLLSLKELYTDGTKIDKEKVAETIAKIDAALQDKPAVSKQVKQKL